MRKGSIGWVCAFILAVLFVMPIAVFAAEKNEISVCNDTGQEQIIFFHYSHLLKLTGYGDIETLKPGEEKTFKSSSYGIADKVEFLGQDKSVWVTKGERYKLTALMAEKEVYGPWFNPSDGSCTSWQRMRTKLGLNDEEFGKPHFIMITNNSTEKKRARLRFNADSRYVIHITLQPGDTLKVPYMPNAVYARLKLDDKNEVKVTNGEAYTIS